MNGVESTIQKKSISKGVGIAVGGFFLIAFAVIFFLNWLEEGNTIQTALVIAAFLVGVLLLLIGLLFTASAVSFNSKRDLVTLQGALIAQRYEFVDHTDHEHAKDGPR